jgi:hypothetical protein
MNNYVSETTVTDELVLTATQIEKYTNLAHKFGRQFRDLSTLLRTNHVWVFFAMGRSHKNDFWVVNPCGSWSYDPQRSADYKPSTSPADWTSKVSWTSMAWFVKLGWMILYLQNTTITLESSFKDDMVKFLGQKPTTSPLPPIEMFADVIKHMFEQAFCSPRSKPMAWEKMLSVLYPFLSFPGGRDRTIFKLETLPATAATKQKTTGKTSASCKYNGQYFFYLILFKIFKLITQFLVMPTLGSSLTERERARITSVQTEDVDFGFADAGDQDYADQDGDQEGDKEEEEEDEDDAEDITPTTRETGKHTTKINYIH